MFIKFGYKTTTVYRECLPTKVKQKVFTIFVYVDFMNVYEDCLQNKV